jgi:hypothetical protein
VRRAAADLHRTDTRRASSAFEPVPPAMLMRPRRPTPDHRRARARTVFWPGVTRVPGQQRPADCLWMVRHRANGITIDLNGHTIDGRASPPHPQRRLTRSRSRTVRSWTLITASSPPAPSATLLRPDPQSNQARASAWGCCPIADPIMPSSSCRRPPSRPVRDNICNNTIMANDLGILRSTARALDPRQRYRANGKGG